MRSTDVDQVLPKMTGILLGLSRIKSMTFGRSKTVSNILIRCPMVSDEINTFCDLLDFVESNTKSVDLVRSHGTSYEDVRYGFGTPKGHTFSL